MPLFHHNSNSQRSPSPPPAQTTSPSRSRGGLFGRRSDSPETYDNNSTNGNGSMRSNSTRSGGGFFSRRRSSSSDSGMTDLKHDPSIVAARQKVTDAEAAEAAADRALNEARAAVRGAKEQVRMLEQEALEE